MTHRENYLRTVQFRHPEWIQIDICINEAMWNYYGRELETVLLRHPAVFPDYKKRSGLDNLPKFDLDRLNTERVVDRWGCTWVFPIPGMDGAVVGHPLEDLDDLAAFVPPEPDIPVWTAEQYEAERKRVQAQKKRGRLVTAGTEHGFLFLRHTYLRGFENAMLDYALDEPRLADIYRMILDYWMPFVRHHVKQGVDVMAFAEDLGTQEATIVSPEDFRRWIKPAYAELMKPCKDNGVLVYLHSDGKTLDILEDQIEAGVDIVNPQDLCNGIDNIKRRIKGKACIHLDIDRQFVVPKGSPRDVDDLIKEEIMELGSPEGGLMMVAGIYPPTPLENLDALCTAAEKYREYWR